MRQKIVAGNWKMNKDLAEAKQLVTDISSKLPKNNVTKIVFPAFPFLNEVSSAFKNSGVKTGAQNCSEHSKGAFTGEVSAAMIASCGAEYCLVGHSERRQYFSETNSQLKNKIVRCFESNLVPVFCVGEKLDERRAEVHFKIVEEQIAEVLEKFSADDLSDMIIAYEPVWAIGTGETASPAQAQEMHSFIRTLIRKLKGDKLAAQMPLLYGGSCNPQNAKELFSCADVDGGLIGGASLKADDFVALMNSF